MQRRTFAASLAVGAVCSRVANAQTASIEVGVLPNISARVLLAQYQPMREFMARELRRPVQVSTAPDWPAFHQRMLALEYDLLITAAHTARLAQLDRGYVPLLSYSPRIRALLLAPKSRPIKSPADLQGQTVVLSNPQSLVALRALQWLGEQGLHNGRDFKTTRTSADDSVGGVLLRGDAVAAVASGGEFRAIPEAVREQLVVHTTIAEVASFIVMASPRMKPQDARELRDTLIRFGGGTEEGRAFFAATGFSGIGEIEPGTMEAMDAYTEATRRLLQ